MKIAFILPAIGKKRGEKYLRSWLMEPLTVAVLKSLTPPEYPCVFFDDRIEQIDYGTDADVIALTVETYTAKRAYEIAARFRKAGKTIIMGGYHPTMMPDEVSGHCDIVVRGNADLIWAGILRDVERGRYEREYSGATAIGYTAADRSIYRDKEKKYLPISLVEIGRGCRHDCAFCSIRSYYGGQYLHRSIEDIVAEIRSCRHRIFFFVDDSIFSDHEFAKALFREVKKLHILWTTQVTLDIARDEELLRLMRGSGCVMILIGFESIEPGNLKQMNKEWSMKLGERDELVERIHRCGISIYASFVFGFDSDTRESFVRNLEFCEKHAFFVTAFNHLLAFPATGTYSAFAGDGRLVSDRWWLESGYTFGTISYRPRQLTAEQLREYCREYKRKFYTFSSIIRRGKILRKRCDTGYVRFVYWVMNILFHFEVDRRYGIPLGENLDEKRK
jgi:radical SAM superfamily enzyme YgiQ (UPF0313 family)